MQKQWECYGLLNQDTFIISMCCAHFNHFDCRIASLSKIFPTLMLYKLWEDGLIDSLDDPLEKYAENFTIKNPLGKSGRPTFSSVSTLSRRSPALSLRRMASQLSGNDIICFIDMAVIFYYSTSKKQTSKNCVAWFQTSESPALSPI